jgi:hypothetical protein
VALRLQWLVVMRNASSLVVGVISLSLLAACGDASTSSGIQRKPNPLLAGGDDGQPSVGENDVDRGNPNANTPPPAPTNPGTASDKMALTLSSATPAADLGDQVQITVTVEPKAGFTGNADLTVTGLPAGATGTFTPATVTLSGAAATATLLINVPVTAAPSAPNTSSPLVITATSAADTATANANFKANPKMKLTIPLNIDALRTTGTKFLDQWGPAFGANPQPLHTQQDNLIVVTVFNADSVAHIVHGNNGFAHGSTTAGQEVQPNAFEMLNGAPRTRSFNVGANVNGYPHEGNNGSSAGFQFTVVAP